MKRNVEEESERTATRQLEQGLFRGLIGYPSLIGTAGQRVLIRQIP
ncbi:hypothetical protein ACFO9Q_19905 [Paenibacillus sp. GCM10023252]